ncbi:hypothetical protein PR202_ga13898 [Eleusine coracana subsp. coracana]|uniref:AB hydrolase-1 domain-containing protein n=1 Tax=Eleusine coracana subsp. coracana TaxID=191504 RepID=A0AAV5CFG5_ELECO|nr:hypothetical protein QOZ80_3AG0211380 [Eleusine coracana subsp. coracana]GJM97008.1 hypothetical protein PR202_ga13898 [Eleusine coracana subsp. coracana]
MPYCLVSGGGRRDEEEEEEVRIFYQRYGHGGTKVLLISGLAGTHESWGPQVKALTGTVGPSAADEEEAPPPASSAAAAEDRRNPEEGVEACCFDNRGAGRSSAPARRSRYTTAAMARDALALMDRLGWRKAHVFGHSMGSMVASKLAAVAPERVASLALLGATGGGYQCVPKLDWGTVSLACRFLTATTPEQRAAIDLETHYTRQYLDEQIGSSITTRREMLYHEYVKGLSSPGGMQSRHGFDGQMNACWTHELSPKELDRIRSAGFPVLIIHGRDDVVAQSCHARRLAEKLQPAAKLVELRGGHLVSHERPVEVNMSLMEVIKASRSNMDLAEWSKVPDKKPDDKCVIILAGSAGSLAKRDDRLTTTYNQLPKIQLFVFGAFYAILEQVKSVIRSLKPVTDCLLLLPP